MHASNTQTSTKSRAINAAHIVSILMLVGTALGTLFQVTGALLFGSIDIELPVVPFWPQLPEGTVITEGPPARVVSGGFTSAEVTVAGLLWDVRILLAAGYALQGATTMLVAYAVYRFAAQFYRAASFKPALTQALRKAGISVIVGGIASQVCLLIAYTRASEQTLKFTSWKSNTDVLPTTGSTGPLGVAPGIHFDVQLWPIWVGLALLALAAVFRYGEKLEAEKEELKRAAAVTRS
ncbi:hypothetical protein BJ994_003021 [Arthrobacter pigmenti]|uniref:Uncharacterized protein n=1 Tax=Arthrobacter pigmenti TaxID=271432 RepID=A0A846RWH6_9MICC|nr:hypothetical protein [Arthrobacter pigmenti]NJC23945.1 hypothetical protein [Arthrobacter pigmenti]